MDNWWELNPGLLKEELDALDASSITYTVDEALMAGGVYALELQFAYGGKTYDLHAAYSPDYPRFAPRVKAPNENFERHQNPMDKSLCLMGDRTQEWAPSNTLANLLNTKFVELIEDNENPQPFEEPQAAPVSGYFPYALYSYVLVDGVWDMPASSGEGRILGCLEYKNNEFRIRGLMNELGWGSASPTVLQWGGNKPKFFQSTFRVPVVRIGSPIMEEDAATQLNNLSVLHQELKTRHWQKTTNGSKCALVGVTFQEEIAPDKTGPVWMYFLCTKKGGREKVERIRAYRAARQDFGKRVPSVQILRSKKILQIGVGAVGAPITMELGKSGMAELRILDGDVIDPGPTIRWPLGLPHYGYSKAGELAGFINTNYPYAHVVPFHTRIGAVETEHRALQFRTQREAVENVDMIVDASAEVAVEGHFSMIAREKSIPYIYAAATPGAIGGLIGRIMPDDTDQGCWYCLQHALYASEALPAPPVDDGGNVLPAGCNHPTFTGAACDLGEVSLQAVRTIISSFRPDAKSVYLRLSFEGPLSLPKWEAHEIPKNSACPVCGGAKSD